MTFQQEIELKYMAAREIISPELRTQAMAYAMREIEGLTYARIGRILRKKHLNDTRSEFLKYSDTDAKDLQRDANWAMYQVKLFRNQLKSGSEQALKFIEKMEEVC